MTDSAPDTSVGTHEVFISHRGIGMKLGFASNLYYALKDRGITSFLDMEELPKGDDVRKYMPAAARRATIHVPIFTEDYGTSCWCLDELVIIMDSQKNRRGKVFPVYYDVKSEDLRKDEGPFATRLKDYFEECKYGEERTKPWKDALEKASWIEGFRPETYGGSDGALINAIANEIQKEVAGSLTVNDIVPKQVGLESKVKDAEQRFCLDDKTTVYVVLLWGMGGIGKTTLAKAIFHSHKNHFEVSSFVESCASQKPFQIQDRLRKELLRDSVDMGDDVATRRASLKRGLEAKKVLIVLDDMKGDFTVVEEIIDPTSLSPGSRILVTSREETVFPHENCFSTKFRGNKYEVRKMADDESSQLFCLHAFKKRVADPNFQEQAKKVVDACDGVPLALEVLGRHLSTMKTKGQWEEAVIKLRSGKYREISDKLMISYEALESDEKQMFEDVACFLIGEDEQKAKFFWDGWIDCYETGLEKLKQRCLVKVDDNDRLTTHDLLRDLGRGISKENRTRFWNDKDVQELMQNRQGLGQIRGLVTALPTLDAGVLSKMKSLRLLFLDGTKLTGKYKGLGGLNIRWLKWKKSPSESLPKQLYLESLIVLEFES